MIKEEDIIKGCIKEDRKMQEVLFKRYASRMLGVCYRYANDMLEAEDILQEGFIKVFDNISSYSGKGSFEGWIKRIMINESLNKIRSRNEKLNFVEEYDVKVIENQTPLDKLKHNELLKMLNLMPEGYRIVFNLFAIEGYSHLEIAEKLNIKHSTSRSQYAKAKTYMQKLIKDLEKEEL